MICKPCAYGGREHGACEDPIRCPCKHGDIIILAREPMEEFRPDGTVKIHRINSCAHLTQGFCDPCWKGLKEGTNPLLSYVNKES